MKTKLIDRLQKNPIPQDYQDGNDVSNQPLPGNSYIYQSLSGADDADDSLIRLLILEPGADDDALVGQLEVISLAQAHRCFEAISYVWGPDIKDQTITIDGDIMPITTSLRYKLRQARLPDKPRALWTDAICINQNDSSEKEHQVRLMGQIYKTSRCTLICFGYGEDDENKSHSWTTKVAQDFATLIAEVGEMMDCVFDDSEFSMGWNSFPYPKTNDPLLAPEKWKSWSHFSTNPWFYRGWVVQEAALSPNCLVLWAGVEIPWMSILRVHEWLARRGPDLDLTARFPWSISLLHSRMFARQHPDEARTLFPTRSALRQYQNVKTLTMLDEARSLHLTDPKDRIYAFMAYQTPDAAMSDLQPDYGSNTSYLDVYRDFAIKYLEKTSDLDILRFVVHEEDNALGSAVPAFPSWVPRWDLDEINTGKTTSRGLNEDVKEMTLLNNNSTLRVKAILFDSVNFVSEVIKWKGVRDRGPKEDVALVVSLWREITNHLIIYPGLNQERLSGLDFLTVISLGSHIGKWDEWKRALEAFANLLEYDDPALSTGHYQKDRNAQSISSFALVSIFGSRFIFLGRGYHYGISPAPTREGDVCAIISGTRSASILRRVPGETDSYIIIGPAYINSTLGDDDKDGTPGGIGEHEGYDIWKPWDLPARDIFLC